MRTFLSAALFLAVLAGPLAAAEPFKSSVQPGEPIAAIFSPININGEFAGEPHCLVCENGVNPVVMIFAREPHAALQSLLSRIDAVLVKHQAQQVGSFAVFLSDKNGLDEQLQAVAKKLALKHVVLAIDRPAGPAGFDVVPEADVTVVLYVEHEVKANHAFRANELNDRAIKAILADLPKIVETAPAK